MANKKPRVGYQNDPKKKPKKKRESYISSLFVNPKKKVTANEKIVKFLIYIALRLVIRSSKWKHPKKNYEIIDRTYKRIMSSDFIYIPSSIAFYLIMAFMPILSLVSFLYMIPGISSWLESISPNPNGDAISDVIGKFIPGAQELLKQIKNLSITGSHTAATITGYITTIISLVVSTWIAAGGFAKLIFTQSYIYEHKYVGGYWMNKIKGMFLVFTFTLSLMTMLIFNVAATSYIRSWKIEELFEHILIYIWLFFGLFFGIFTGLILLFKLSPRYRIKFKNVIPGAMVATIPATLFMGLFGSISSIWSYGAYGAVGAVMYVGMASLILVYFIFVGLITNAAYYKTFVGDKVRNKWTLSKK